MVEMVRVRVAEGKKLYWRGRDRTGGEIIEVPDKEARLIVAVKKGELVPAGGRRQVPDPRPLTSASIEAADPAQEDGADKVGRRRYNRRDMRATDE